jgi:hypothetical protein
MGGEHISELYEQGHAPGDRAGQGFFSLVWRGLPAWVPRAFEGSWRPSSTPLLMTLYAATVRGGAKGGPGFGRVVERFGGS